MSKENRAPQAQPPRVESASEDSLGSVRSDLDGTRDLVLRLAESVLIAAKSHAKCRNCTRLACQFVTAAHREFGTQIVALCDGCELTAEWRATGTVNRITDTVILDTIKVANELICSRR